MLGPRLIDGVVSPRPIQGIDDLPRGIDDEQAGGRYRTREIGP